MPTGLAFDIPKGQYGILATKSQLAWEYSLTVLGGVIDPGYTREVFVMIHVLGKKDFPIKKGKDFIQLILAGGKTPTLKEVKQLSPSIKRTKQYSSQILSPVKRQNQPKLAKDTTKPKCLKKYRLRETRHRRTTIKPVCKCYD